MTGAAYDFALQAMLQDARENTLPMWGGGVDSFDSLMTSLLKQYHDTINQKLLAFDDKRTTLKNEIEKRVVLLSKLKSKTPEEGRELIRQELRTNQEIMSKWAKDMESQLTFLDDCQKHANDIGKEGVRGEMAKAVLKTYGPFMNQTVLKLKELRRRQSKIIPEKALDDSLDTAFDNKIIAVIADKDSLEKELTRTNWEYEALTKVNDELALC